MRRVIPPFIAIAWGVGTGYYIFSEPLRAKFEKERQAAAEAEIALEQQRAEDLAAALHAPLTTHPANQDPAAKKRKGWLW